MKFNKNLLGWSLLILLIALFILSYKISWVKNYIVILMIIIMAAALVFDVISLKKVYYSKEKRLLIKVPYYGDIYNISYILLIILSFNTTELKEHRSIFIIAIIIFIIQMPIEYKKNSEIHFFENGIFIYATQFNQKVIPYDKIKKLNFIEYLKGKFLLDIELERSFGSKAANQHKIKRKNKEEILLFISDFIDKEKINEIKEYKEDKLW